MLSNEDKVLDAIAEQAGEWFVANEEGLSDGRDAAALTQWLKRSPAHIEAFLAVSEVARDLKEARADPTFSLDAILERARAADDGAVQLLHPQGIDGSRSGGSRVWITASWALAACAMLSVGVYVALNANLFKAAAPEEIASLHFETRRGELLTHRFADNSVLHLNTDSAVTIRYGRHTRVAVLSSGEADFDVVHDADRPFRVLAGAAEIVDVGTRFDVQLKQNATVITVVEGEVAVSAMAPSAAFNQSVPPAAVQLSAGQQVTLAGGTWPALPIEVDVQRATAWLRHQIVFDHEPLESVVAEYNRYTVKTIEIATPALKSLQISGVFATDDTEAFVAFLRSLKGVQVEVTDTAIRVSRR